MAKVQLHSPGVREVLRSVETASAVNGLAHSVAAAARALGVPTHMPVTVQTYVTDRAAASVAVEHYAGMGMEAKYGYLQRAVASRGLTVRRRS